MEMDERWQDIEPDDWWLDAPEVGSSRDWTADDSNDAIAEPGSDDDVPTWVDAYEL